MIAYRKANGAITDLRMVGDDYLAQPGETLEPGDALPDPDTLLTTAELLAAATATVVAQAKVLRAQIFNVLDGLQSSALTSGNALAFTAADIESVKSQLRTITADVDLSACTSIDQMRAAYVARWQAIAVGAPAALAAQFVALIK